MALPMPLPAPGHQRYFIFSIACRILLWALENGSRVNWLLD